MGPYISQDICGKRVTLKNCNGKILHTQYNTDHIKPYWRPERKDFVTAESQVDEPLTATRSYISPNKAEAHNVTVITESNPVRFPPERIFDSIKYNV